MYKIQYNFFVLLMILLSSESFSQISAGGIPVSFKKNSIVISAKTTLASLDNDYERARAKSIADSLGEDFKMSFYGRNILTSIDIKAQGQFELQENGGKLWLLKVESSTAYGMQFYFDKYKLPFGASLFIFSEDSSSFLGAYTHRNNPINDSLAIKFGTTYLKGNHIILEYYEPPNAEFEGELRIAKIVHVFDDIFNKTSGSGYGPWAYYSAPCEINVSCPLGDGWENEASSVVLILANDDVSELGARGTGAMINNTSQDGRPLLLTANHLRADFGNTGSLVYNSNDWIFVFNHQTEECDNGGGDITQSASLNQSIFGSTLLAWDESNTSGTGSLTSDFALLELNGGDFTKQQLATWGICYSGWTIESNPPSPVTGIHHPRGDIKKVSRASSKGSLTDDWEVNWDAGKGTAENGSSGSPLFDSNHRIIGQLADIRLPGVLPADWPFNAECDDSFLAYYGKFSVSWQEGMLWSWLDPNNTGLTSVNTYCPTSSTGQYPPGGSTANVCLYKVGSPMMVNDDIDSPIACAQGNIELRPFNSRNCENPTWKFDPTVTEHQNCNDALENDEWCDSYWIFWCTCYYFDYFIEIMEVDDNLNQVGQAHSKWFRKQIPPFNFNTTYSPVVIDQNKLNELGIMLDPFKTYRIKLAFGYWNGWGESIRIFKIEPNDVYLNNTTIVNEVGGRNVTLENVTVYNGITVSASQEILILPNSDLFAGTYMIEDDFCVPGSGKTDETTNIDDNTTYTYQEQSNEQPKIITDKPSILIVPNPNTGKFNLMVNGYESQDNIEVLAFNLFGSVVYNNRLQPTGGMIDISNYSSGIYFIKVKLSDNLILSEKIIYR